MNDNLSKKTKIIDVSMVISSISTGFVEIPSQISLNLYVQGCKKHCKSCHNKDLQPFEGGTTINLEDLPNVLQKRDLPTWICWLGGDAVYQPEGFMEFNRFFKDRGYKICLYTGKLFSEVQNLIKDVDLVIDGEWNGTKIDEEGTNQEIYLKINNVWENITFSQLKNKLKEEN